MARIRHVFPSDRVCHLWAHQTQSDARNAQGNISFNGPTLVSYGHDTIGRIVKLEKRKHALVLIQSNNCSVTTAKQIREAESATSHMVSVRVPNLIDTSIWVSGTETTEGYYVKAIDHNRNLQYFAREIERVEAKIPASRTYTNWYFRKIDDFISEANVYSRYFGLRKVFKSAIPDTVRVELTAKSAERQRISEETRNERHRIRREKADAERIPEAQRLMDSWLAGEGNGEYVLTDASRVLNRTALRIVGDNVQTSMGVDFPVSHAIVGLALVRRTIASGIEWRTNGHTLHLGHFKIDGNYILYSLDSGEGVKYHSHMEEVVC